MNCKVEDSCHSYVNNYLLQERGNQALLLGLVAPFEQGEIFLNTNRQAARPKGGVERPFLGLLGLAHFWLS